MAMTAKLPYDYRAIAYSEAVPLITRAELLHRTAGA